MTRASQTRSRDREERKGFAGEVLVIPAAAPARGRRAGTSDHLKHPPGPDPGEGLRRAFEGGWAALSGRNPVTQAAREADTYSRHLPDNVSAASTKPTGGRRSLHAGLCAGDWAGRRG